MWEGHECLSAILGCGRFENVKMPGGVKLLCEQMEKGGMRNGMQCTMASKGSMRKEGPCRC